MLPLLWLTLHLLPWPADPSDEGREANAVVELSAPDLESEISVEQALKHRRSIRAWSGRGLELEQLSQLLWAAQGVTDARQRRTAPSAGAMYPIEVLTVVGEVEGVEAGVYRYQPRGHRMVRLTEGDRRQALTQRARAQEWVADAPVVLVITAVIGRTAARYGSRAERYVEIEAGCVAQNVYLQSETLGLGTVLVGAFSDAGAGQALRLDDGERVLALMPVGWPR